MEFKHTSVLFEECMEGLKIRPDGIYADGTLGGGGHSSGICSRLGENGTLIGIDRDTDALKAVVALRLAVMLQHAKVNFKADKLKVRVKNRIEMTVPKEWLDTYPTLLYWLEKECEWWEDVGITMTVRSS